MSPTYDHVPNYGNADNITATTATAVTVGDCLVSSGNNTVATSSGASGAFVGVAGFSQVAGDLVLVQTVGVHTLRASGAITAGARVTTAANGAVAVGDPAIGVAQSAASGGTVKVKLIAAAGSGSGGGASGTADWNTLANKPAVIAAGADQAAARAAIAAGSADNAAAALTNKTLTAPTINGGTITGASGVASATQVGTTAESIGSAGRISALGWLSAGAGAAALPEPMMVNALAYHTQRGGTVRVTINGVDATAADYAGVPIDRAFAPHSAQAAVAVKAASDVVVVEIDVSAYRTWASGGPGPLGQPIIGCQGRVFSFARSVTLEAFDGTTWSTVGSATNVVGMFQARSTVTATKLRWTFTQMVLGSSVLNFKLYAVPTTGDVLDGFGPLFPRSGGQLFGTAAAPPQLVAGGSDSSIPLVVGGKNADTVTPDGAPYPTVVPPPASATAAGRRGQIAFAADNNSMLVCVTTGAAGSAVWKRCTLATF